MNRSIFIGVLFVIGAAVLVGMNRCKPSGNSGGSPYTPTTGGTGCGSWAGSESPAYAMTAATSDVSVPGVPEETGNACPGSPKRMTSGSSEGCHCN